MPEEVALEEDETKRRPLKALGQGVLDSVLLCDAPCRGLAKDTEVSQAEAGTFQME